MITEAQLRQALANRDAKLAELNARINALENGARPKSVEEYILTKWLALRPGARLFTYSLVGTQDFTISQLGVRGNAINMLVSQDGPFILTHYPMVMWKPNAPSTATNLGMWRSVYHGPLPTQAVTTDYISISYEMQDAGSNRNMQNLPMPPLISTVGNMIEMPVWTEFAENSTLAFYPTYEDINFNSSGTATTGGQLVVCLPGFRFVPTGG